MIDLQEIRTRALRRWETGQLLREWLEPSGMFPWSIPAKAPAGRGIIAQFAQVKDWIARLESHRDEGYRILYKEVDHLQLGTQKIPSHLVVDTLDDCLRLIGKTHEFGRFKALTQATQNSHPAVMALLKRRPMEVLGHADRWDRCLAVCSHFAKNPRPGLYLRQLDIPGVDSKFIESHAGILSDMLDLMLPPDAMDPTITGRTTKHFITKYGLRQEPALIRLRILDPSCSIAGLCDLTIPLADFQRLTLPVRTVFITENKTNGLAFPDFPSSAVIFGLGYGVDMLTCIDWLKGRKLYYWGDMDSHGYRILDQFRGSYPHLQSMLMDMQTFTNHLDLCVAEPAETRCIARLERLHPHEQEVYNSLIENHLGHCLRLEQERIAFSHVESFLKQIQP